MCETNGGIVNTTEQEQDTTGVEEASHDEGNGVVKFDIGEFVHNHRKILLQIGPWIRFYNTLTNIVCWNSPYVSLFWLSVCCIVAVKSPVCFLIMPLVYILLTMVVCGIKSEGRHKNTSLKHRAVKKKTDDHDLNVKATVEKQVQEDLREFTSLLVQLEVLSEWISNSLENINRILKWEDFRTSLCISVGLLASIMVLLLVPLALILLVAVLCLFCLNLGFRPIALQVSSSVTGAIQSFLEITGLRDVLPHKLKKRLSNSFSDQQDEWYDAQSEERARHSSDEYSDDDVYEDSSLTKKKLDSSSILSQLADYRRKQKKLNSGKCNLCQVPFSSILKKRQYCRHCGESFCSKCCSHRVKRSVFGATAPAAYEETVLVCKPCYDVLMNVNDNPGPPW